MLLPVYRPVLLDLDTAAGPIKGLAFVANRDHRDIRPGIPFDEQASMIAHASGFLGDNFDYLSKVYEGLEVLGVRDSYVSELYAATVALREASARAGWHSTFNIQRQQRPLSDFRSQP
jgi:cation transport protein ChaC